MSTFSPAAVLFDTLGNPIISSIAAPAGTERGLIVRNIPSGIQEVLPDHTPNNTVTGNITNTQAVTVSTDGCGNARFVITGTWAGTLVFESTVDGITWDNLFARPSPPNQPNAVVSTSTTVNGTWECLVAGIKQIRVRGNTVTSGTATVYLAASVATDTVASIIVGMNSLVSSGNSTQVPLGAGATFTGLPVDTLGFAHVSMSASSDVVSATDGIEFQWSPDLVYWSTRGVSDLRAARTGINEATDLSQRLHDRYFRIKYTNGASPQTWFKLQCILHNYPTEADTKGVDQQVRSGDDALLVKSVITGQRPTGDGGGFGDVLVDHRGALKVTPSSTHAAFGSLLVNNEVVLVNVQFPYAIVPRLVNTVTANGGTVTWSSGRAALNTSVATNGAASLESREVAKYTPGQGLIWRGTFVPATPTAGCIQRWGIGTSQDGYFFGYTGTQLEVVRRYNGTETTIPQSAWNGDDKFDGTGLGAAFDPTKGYPFQIQYQWLGYGAIRFFIEDPYTGDFVKVHTINYAGSSTLPSSQNPSFPARVEITKTSGAANLTCYTASLGVVTEGLESVGSDIPWATTNAITGAPTTGATALNIRNKSGAVLGGTVANRVTIHVDHISIRAASAKDLYMTLFLNPTLGGVPAWADINTANSVVERDIAGTTNGTGGFPIKTFCVAGGTTVTFDITAYNLKLRPGEWLSAVMFAESATVDGRVAIGWHESM